MPRQYIPRVTRPCDHCGILYTKPPSVVGRFCSLPCRYAAHIRPRPHTKRMPSVRPIEDRFWEKVDKDGPVIRPELGPCWLWIGARDRHGYGSIGEGAPSRRTVRVYRLSYTWAHGPVPFGLKVLHHCDNPPCVRPAHLYAGTAQQNSDDMIVRGRAAIGDRNGSRTHPERIARGTRIPQARLTDDLVREIRRRDASGEESRRAIARDLGVTHETVNRACRLESWTHVAD